MAVVLVVLAAIGMIALGVAQRQSLGAWQWLAYGGAILALAGASLFYRQVGRAEIDLDQREQSLTEKQQAHEEEQRELVAARQLLEREVASQSQKLQQQEQSLAQRMATFHEWFEFPLPIDLADPAAPLSPTDAELEALVRKDRELHALLQQESELLFEYIRQNRYAEDGKFQLALLRDDLLTLATKCARVYRPDVENPLLETSVERVLRAISRSALQMLVVMEKLPLDVKQYNINDIYMYVRQAVKAYGAYKSVQAYWSYANTAYYLGRLALGANPFALGAWWFVGTLGREGAQMLATKLVHRHALAMLQDIIRVVGYEVALTYGGDFRHRDPNWIYGVELTSLVAAFPLSRDSLKHALSELSVLTLRSEYDRAYLVRCLAAGKDARAAEHLAPLLLTASERSAIAQRLERFLQTYLHGKTAERVQAWQRDVEHRLDIKLTISGLKGALPREAQLLDAARSLTGFLASQKQLDPPEILAAVGRTRVWKELSTEQQAMWRREIDSQTSLLFAEPDLDPSSEISTWFLDDLILLAAAFPPRTGSMYDLLRETAIYLRQPEKKVQEQWERRLAEALRERSSASWIHRAWPASAMPAALDILAQEQLQFLYGGVALDPPRPEKEELFLLGTPTRLVLFSAAHDPPEALWKGDAQVQRETQRNLLAREAIVRGGTWLKPGDERRVIRISKPIFTTSDGYFQPLLQWNGGNAN